MTRPQRLIDAAPGVDDALAVDPIRRWSPAARRARRGGTGWPAPGKRVGLQWRLIGRYNAALHFTPL
jgi:hypothetical protein